MTTLNINPQLTAQEREAGEALLWEFKDLFVESVEEMGSTHLAEHEIKLKPGASPYYCPGLRRYSPEELKFLRENVEEELQAGKII